MIELVVAYQLGGNAQSDGPGSDDTRQNLSRPGVILKEKGKIITLLIWSSAFCNADCAG